MKLSKLIESYVVSALKEDVFSILNYGQSPPTDQQASTYAKLVANRVHNLHDRLGIRLDVVVEVMRQVETDTKTKLTFDQNYLVASNLGSLAKGALLEYQEAAKQQAVSYQQESLTLPTVASFSLGAAKGMSATLLLLKPIGVNYGAKQLEHALQACSDMMKLLEDKTVPWSAQDATSLSLYKAMWDHGFQSSKTFLSDQDYLSNKDNARTLCEGLFYKMALVLKVFPATRILLSVCAGYLLQAELNPKSADWLKAIHDRFING